MHQMRIIFLITITYPDASLNEMVVFIYNEGGGFSVDQLCVGG